MSFNLCSCVRVHSPICVTFSLEFYDECVCVGVSPDLSISVIQLLHILPLSICLSLSPSTYTLYLPNLPAYLSTYTRSIFVPAMPFMVTCKGDVDIQTQRRTWRQYSAPALKDFSRMGQQEAWWILQTVSGNRVVPQFTCGDLVCGTVWRSC